MKRRLNFVRQGNGPTVVLSHALGCDLSMWDEVAALLAADYSVLRYEHRGHGTSEIVPGPFGIADMADDAAELIAAQAEGPVHFVGLSLGGMVAQQLAVSHPALVASIVVANSSSYYSDAARRIWQSRIETVLAEGMTAIADGAMERWFTPGFRADPYGAARVAASRAVLEASNAPAYAAACEAVSRIDFRGTNPLVACPTLVIGGTRDEATPMVMSELICQAIPGARLATLDASHLSAIEKPAAFAALVAGFISGL